MDRENGSGKSYDFLLLEEADNPLCPYRSFLFYLSKIDPALKNADVSIFLNPGKAHGKFDIWYRKPFAARKRRNYFTDLKALITLLSSAYSADNPLKWEKHYTKHSIRVLHQTHQDQTLNPTSPFQSCTRPSQIVTQAQLQVGNMTILQTSNEGQSNTLAESTSSLGSDRNQGEDPLKQTPSIKILASLPDTINRAQQTMGNDKEASDRADMLQKQVNT